MKRITITTLLLLSELFLTTQRLEAQIPIVQIIQQGIKKVIIAIDLKVQRLQNKTIWLQNAQKTLEHALSKIHLDEINDWANKQRELYANYFDELRIIKTVLLSYSRVKDIMAQQIQIISEYKAAWAIFRQDKNFTRDELDYIFNVFQGMMDRSVKNIEQLSLVINSFTTQMSDAKRLEMINIVSADVEQTLMDLKQFNEENKMLSLQRATERNEIEYVKRLYGIQ